MKKTLFILTVLALGFTACNKFELQETPEQTPAEAPVCYFNLPASFDGDGATKAVTIGESTAISSFEATDKIYVYIERPGNTPAFAYDESTSKLVPLTISNINGATCDLSGALKFYYVGPALDNKTYTPQENDRVHLLYNLNAAGLNQLQYPYFRYDSLSGDKDGYEDRWGGGNPNYFFWGANHFDFAEAIMKVTAVSGNTASGYSLTLGKVDAPTDTKVSFKSLQSMFRQRLSFTDKGGDPITPIITRFRINSANNKIVYYYHPIDDNNSPDYDYEYTEINNPTFSGDRDIYFPLMFNDVNRNDALIFTAYDDAENVYAVTKNAPVGGFANGKYYYGSAALAWHHNMRPTVTGTTAVPSSGKYTIVDNPVNISINGYSEDYYLEISEGHGGTIALNNVTATHGDNYFITQENVNPAGDISLVLTGTNTISCNDDRGILVYGNLKLSCTGGIATLAVTVTSSSSFGLSATNYDGSDVSALAADGYIVTCSDATNNGDGTYTWTYTVHRVVSLSSAYAIDGNSQKYYAAENGDILTGNFGGALGYVTIPDGATVTLNGVAFNAPESGHPAIHCLGSANLIVSGENTITAGYDSSYPAIYVPSGSTLTISGTGTLTAWVETGTGAGIGGGYVVSGSGTPIHCGNIVLSGATIYAKGGTYAAGIGGGGYSSCGNITINGATVKTAQGGQHGAGIGSGEGGSCGNILIGSGSVGETPTSSQKGAIGGSDGAGIGCGEYGYCGTITIGSDITRVDIWNGGGAYYIGGDYGKFGTVTIDGVEMTGDPVDYPRNSDPTAASHFFPNLYSKYYYGNNWSLYK